MRFLPITALVLMSASIHASNSDAAQESEVLVDDVEVATSAKPKALTAKTPAPFVQKGGVTQTALEAASKKITQTAAEIQQEQEDQAREKINERWREHIYTWSGKGATTRDSRKPLDIRDGFTFRVQLEAMRNLGMELNVLDYAIAVMGHFFKKDHFDAIALQKAIDAKLLEDPTFDATNSAAVKALEYERYEPTENDLEAYPSLAKFHQDAIKRLQDMRDGVYDEFQIAGCAIVKAEPKVKKNG